MIEDNPLRYMPMQNTTGWKCPGCGACYSPSTPACFKCNGNTPEPKNYIGLKGTAG